MVRALEKEGWNKTVLCRFLLGQTSDTSRFPNNQEFERSWVMQPVYQSLSAKRVKALLEPLELRMRSNFHETKTLDAGLTIEHILPQSWWQYWPLPDGTMSRERDVWRASYSLAEEGTKEGQIVSREKLKHTIGNLTLLTQPFNSSISNGSWESKQEAFRDLSLLEMNRSVARKETWGESEIRSRSSELFMLAKHEWEYPTDE